MYLYHIVCLPNIFFNFFLTFAFQKLFQNTLAYKFTKEHGTFVIFDLPNNKNHDDFLIEMVSSRKVQSFTNRSRRSKSKVSPTTNKNLLTKKTPKRKVKDREEEPKTEEKVEKNELLENFGVDLGPFGQDLYEWLWPKNDSSKNKASESIQSMKIDERFLQSRFVSYNEKKANSYYNNNIHAYLLHNYASERFVDIYKRLAFHMKITPRILFREIGAITGKFGINILDPNAYSEVYSINNSIDDEKGKEIRSDILCLRRIKFEVYSLIGAKLLRYTMLFLLRYIRLGIPNEIKIRFLTDLIKQDYTSVACSMACNQIDFGDNKNNPLNQTYPIRNSFESMGYPYSDQLFYSEPNSEDVWSPSKLVDPHVFNRLSKKNKSKLVCVAASLHPEYALQIVKNIAFAAGYKSERELLTNFCLNCSFTSRGSRSFISKLKEERLVDEKLRQAAKLYKKCQLPSSLKSALDILVEVPYISGLIKRHLESGRKIMSLKRARMILKRVRSEVELLPEDMVLWDILKSLISRKVLNAPSRLYKQAAKQILALKNYLSPNLKQEIESRGVDAVKLYKDTNGLPQDLESISWDERVDLARKIRKNVKNIWLENRQHSFEDTGIRLVDALSATAGYKDINNVLTIVSMLSKPPQTKVERLSRQPGPEFEHSPRLEFKDFKNKIM
ncbi:uncharacterized protein TA20160 [Theileria annulata]|uniref:Uncharacterized protein n=1 Tax=Theileria annulata TaxID=5874 RepID=Q4UHC5_THEAN|nr:uncharacterized protein TA20160 [Theileria annulata]CAI73514.1 hypothetical protein TA20160 [Theileria annulata]|eukprot:XP_954191.1 hypothetical protein TA20160 [Theileria annulata]